MTFFKKAKDVSDLTAAEVALVINKTRATAFGMFLISMVFITCALCLDYKTRPTREYQFTIDKTGATIYDGDRKVGFLRYDSSSAFDSLMMEDNR